MGESVLHQFSFKKHYDEILIKSLIEPSMTYEKKMIMLRMSHDKV